MAIIVSLILIALYLMDIVPSDNEFRLASEMEITQFSLNGIIVYVAVIHKLENKTMNRKGGVQCEKMSNLSVSSVDVF
jgi:hypothetical protein